jgi:hypothetical protein
MDEKRSHDRYTLWFPVTVHVVSQDAASGAPVAGGQDLQVWAVCRDASAGGILLTGSRELRVGEVVTVNFRVAPEGPDRSISGRIVRVDVPEDNPRAVWPYRMAVEFLEPDAALQSMFARASSRPPPPP